MTVSYSLKVSQASLCSFTRLLFMWQGSIYKLIWKELVVFLLLYYGMSLLYRFALTTPEQKETFELICVFFKDHIVSIIPLSFVLGFYVSIVISRWWGMYETLPWTDSISQLFAAHIKGDDEETRKCRRTLVRWLNLTATIVFTSVSVPVLKRFPTLGHLVNAGLMTKEERKLYDKLETPHVKFWMPCGWACNLVAKLREEGKIKDDVTENMLIGKIQAHRGLCGGMMGYDWISVPLVYTQVVTIATYTYFLAKLFADQFLDPAKDYDRFPLDFYFPILTILEFFFYFGWLKVAEAIINPYGDDDDDFELSYIIDRNFQVGLLIVDDLYGQIPPIERDMYWDVKEFELPYTETTVKRKLLGTVWLGSTVDVLLKAKDFIVAVPGNIITFGGDVVGFSSFIQKGDETELQPVTDKDDAPQGDIPGAVPEGVASKKSAAAAEADVKKDDDTDGRKDRAEEKEGLMQRFSSKKKKTQVVKTPSGAKVRVVGKLPPEVGGETSSAGQNV
ncbi:bestrophin-2a-like [Ptychodera flava]|uniref:bestrophin-2a-like n=1 Tax=Ptychodera flava TaxID=63121 RepID=UPI00396A9F97